MDIWQKRVVWLFGYWIVIGIIIGGVYLIYRIKELIEYFILNGIPYAAFTLVLILALWIIPLFLFRSNASDRRIH